MISQGTADVNVTSVAYYSYGFTYYGVAGYFSEFWEFFAP